MVLVDGCRDDTSPSIYQQRAATDLALAVVMSVHLAAARSKYGSEVTRPRLSRDARKLLETDLGSVEKLEAMRYLRSAGGAVPRAELVRDVNLERETVRTAVGELVSAELIEATGERGTVRLGPRAAGEAFEEVMRMYDEDRVLVVTTLSSIAMERIRGMAARAFGEALVGRKKPDGDREG